MVNPNRQAKKDEETYKLWEEGLTLKEIAAKLNIHFITAHRRIKRVRRNVKPQ